MRLVAHIVLRFQFTFTIGSIRLLRIIQANRTEIHLVSPPITAQATHQQKLFRFATGSSQCLYEVMRILCIDTEEIPLIERLCQTCIMDNIIPGALLTDKILQLGSQCLPIVIFEINKMNPFIL